MHISCRDYGARFRLLLEMSCIMAHFQLSFATWGYKFALSDGLSSRFIIYGHNETSSDACDCDTSAGLQNCSHGGGFSRLAFDAVSVAGLQFRGEDADVSALGLGLRKDTFINQPITVTGLAEWYFEIIEDHLGLADGLLVLPIEKK